LTKTARHIIPQILAYEKWGGNPGAENILGARPPLTHCCTSFQQLPLTIALYKSDSKRQCSFVKNFGGVLKVTVWCNVSSDRWRFQRATMNKWY